MVFSGEDRILIEVWPANSPGLNLVNYRIMGKLQERVYREWIRDVDQRKSRLIEEWQIAASIFCGGNNTTLPAVGH